MECLHSHFPKIHRISSYALPKDILSKSDEELEALRQSGLNLLYVGIESGDDEVLKKVHKGETFDSTREALLKVKKAGIKLSLMVVNGLGGKKYSRQHAIQSARLVNEVQPEYVSTLVLSLPLGMDKYKEGFGADYIPMNKTDLMEEMAVFIEHSDLEQSIFRSDHASNYLILKAVLGRDKDLLLSKIDDAIRNPELAGLREEYQLGF
jgi:radical SAM superfamily enzyme YgiQ (UPF0313 family)